MRILGAMLGGTISSYNDEGTVKLGKPNFACGFLSENFPCHEFVFPEFKTYSSEDATPYLYRDALKKIMKSFNVSAEQAMDSLEIPAANREQYLALLK